MNGELVREVARLICDAALVAPMSVTIDADSVCRITLDGTGNDYRVKVEWLGVDGQAEAEWRVAR